MLRKSWVVCFAGLFTIAGSAEAQSFATGLRFLEPGQYASIPLASPPMRGELPANIDLSAFFPASASQGQQGSCVAWSVAYALKSYQEKRERNWSLDERAHQFSPAALYNSIKLGGCMDGAYIADAFDALASWGALPLSEFPYDERTCERIPTAAEKARGGEYRISSSRRVNVQSVAELKSHLAAGFPVVVGMLVGNNLKDYNGGVVTTEPGFEGSGHAVVIVGYDDALNAFKIINSWGPAWGEKGYFWINYDTFKRVTREAYASQDIVPQPAPRPVPAPAPGPTPVPIQEKLTSYDLLNALRLSQKPASDVVINGSPVRPVSMWLQLPQNLAETVQAVRYEFNHPTFKSPKYPVQGSNAFLTSWKGYGCIEDAAVIASLSDGTEVRAPYNLCNIWDTGKL